MKRFLAAFIVFSMLFFAAGCGSSSKNGDKQPDADENSQDQDTEENDSENPDAEEPDEEEPDEDEPSPADEKTLESIRNLAEKYVRFSNGTGVVAGYGINELTSFAYGVRNSKTQEPLSTDDLFEIGSISKNFTATTLLLLQEEGKIDLNQTIDKWFPDFEKGDKITVRMLLNHTSGIQEQNSYGDPEDTVEEVNGYFNFEPGTDWSYCNTNFILAGLIINKVTGKEAHEVIREKILDPLGMEHTFMKNYEEYPLEEKARGHAFDEYGNIFPYDHGYNFWTAGGIVSNAGDLFKYVHALFNGEIISQDSLDQMLDLVKVSGIPYYGLGIQSGEGPHGRFYSHGGSVLYMCTLFAYYPETGEIHIIFNNFNESTGEDILNGEMEYVLIDGAEAEKGNAFPAWDELISDEDDTQIFAVSSALPDYPSEELGYAIGYFLYPEDYYPDFFCLHYMFKYQNYVKIIQECPESERYYKEGMKVWRTDIDMYLSEFKAAAESGEPTQNFYITKYDYYYDITDDFVSKICYSLEESDPDRYMMISSSQHPSGAEYYSIWGKSKMTESVRATGCECYNKDDTTRECDEDSETGESKSGIFNMPKLL